MKGSSTSRKERTSPKRRSRALRLYGWVLRLYPEAHRRAFGEPMLMTFLDSYRDAVETQRGSETRFWVGVLSDESRSLVREHLATLGERGRSMQSRLSMQSALPVVGKLSGGVLALLLWVVVLYLLFPITVLLFPITVPPYAWLLATVISVTALVVVSYLVRSLPRPAASGAQSTWRSSWWRLGLALGAIAGFGLLVLNVVFVLTQSGPGQAVQGLAVVGENFNQVVAALALASTMGPLWLLSLPLLAGAIGILGAYTSGRQRIGLAAGALAGGTMLAIQIVSLVLLMAGKNAMSPAAPLVAGTAGKQDMVSILSGAGLISSTQVTLSLPFTLLVLALLTVLIWPAPLVVGSLLGARAARNPGRALDSGSDSARAASRRARAIQWTGLGILLAALGPLFWLGLLLVQIVQTQTSGFGKISALLLQMFDFTTMLPDTAWLLAVLATLVAAYVTMRPAARPPRISVEPES